jgi:hypothetical protein
MPNGLYTGFNIILIDYFVGREFPANREKYRDYPFSWRNNHALAVIRPSFQWINGGADVETNREFSAARSGNPTP